MRVLWLCFFGLVLVVSARISFDWGDEAGSTCCPPCPPCAAGKRAPLKRFSRTATIPRKLFTRKIESVPAVQPRGVEECLCPCDCNCVPEIVVNVPADHGTLTAAYLAAPAGATIKIQDGTYDGVTVPLEKQVHFFADGELVRVRSNTALGAAFSVSGVGANGISFDGLRILCNDASHIAFSLTDVEGARIADNILSGCAGPAIYLEDTIDATVQENVITTPGYGIKIVATSLSEGNFIYGNSISGTTGDGVNWIGISMNAQPGASVTGSRITANGIDGPFFAKDSTFTHFPAGYIGLELINAGVQQNLVLQNQFSQLNFGIVSDAAQFNSLNRNSMTGLASGFYLLNSTGNNLYNNIVNVLSVEEFGNVAMLLLDGSRDNFFNTNSLFQPTGDDRCNVISRIEDTSESTENPLNFWYDTSVNFGDNPQLCLDNFMQYQE